MIIGKTFSFEAAHYLPGHSKCGHTHGHTYRVIVEIEGPVGIKSGMVMDLHLLGSIVRDITDQWDHSLLNDWFTMPTCENMCQYLAVRTQQNLPEGLRVYRVSLQEGEGGYAVTMD